MIKKKVLDDLLKKGNGYLKTADVTKMGISRENLSRYVSDNKLDRVARGIYASSDTWDDDLYIIGLKNKRIIYSHETALYLLGLMEREPIKKTVTVNLGYNASHLTKLGIKVFTVIDEYFEIGKSETATKYGNLVTVYDMDRTICDVIRSKDKIDIQIFNYALKGYMASSNKKLPNLMKYAKILGVENKVRTYTEVML